MFSELEGALSELEFYSEEGKIKGSALKAGRINANNRIYPEEVVREAVNKAREKGGIPVVFADSSIEIPTPISSFCGVVTDLSIDEGSNLIFEASILDSPKGHLLAESLRSGMSFTASVSGYGRVEDLDGLVLVSEGYELEAVHLTPTRGTQVRKLTELEKKLLEEKACLFYSE